MGDSSEFSSVGIDGVDRQILAALQENARTSNADIARALGMAPSAILERIKKLEQKGIVAGYEARLAPRKVGLGLSAFVLVRAIERVRSNPVGARLAEIPEVLEVHSVAGEDCYLVKVRARDTDDLAHLLQERFGAIEGIHATRTTIVLHTLKETTRLPLERPETAP